MDQTLSADAAAAICRHMNDDHADAVAGYARIFGHIENVRTAELVALNGEAMELAVDTSAGRITTHIPFDHILRDTDDARTTLVAMAQRAGIMSRNEH